MFEKWKDRERVFYGVLGFIAFHLWKKHKELILMVSCVLFFIGVLITDNPIFGIGVGICCIMNTWYSNVPMLRSFKWIGYSIGVLCVFTNLMMML